MSTFSNLGLSNPLIDVLNNLGFTTPTPVQEQAIPLLLSDTPIDFIGLAQTGTGKTAAFGLPLIDLIDSDNRSVQALVLAPTRELVQQTAKQVAQFAKGVKGVNVEVVFGGAAITNQISALRKPTQIVIATPGRLIDLIKRKAIKLDQVQYVVLVSWLFTIVWLFMCIAIAFKLRCVHITNIVLQTGNALITH